MRGWPSFQFGDTQIFIPVAGRASAKVIVVEIQRILNSHPDCPFIVECKGINMKFITPRPTTVIL